ncbi:MAG: MBL fold metallo-hydrolase [Candidatus Aenigmarchaeota archaeon]|nr:MBL fold metallo-hydrolase [Candidatus Aenigmarchaeota archaeon]
MGIEIDTGVEKFLWEYGVSVQTGELPLQPTTRLDAVFVTHAHLDHSAMLPHLYRIGYRGSVYGDPATFGFTSILYRDYLKLQKRFGFPLNFLIEDVKRMERNIRFLRPGESEDFTASTIRFHNAGHIPGSVMIELETHGKHILFTGDVKFIDTRLMTGAVKKFENIDVIISESTYHYTNHPDRKGLEREFRKVVCETIENGGICLIPAFAVGRTQELLLMLEDLDYPIYLDGMGIHATESVLRHPKSIRDHKKLQRAFSKAHKIRRSVERERILKKPSVIITTAGMLNGGPVVYYMERLHDREDSSIVLTGYQVEGTAGRTLLDTGRFVVNDMDIKPKMKIFFFDFSAHTDRNHLLEFYNKVCPEKILLIHGEKTDEFAKELKNMGFDAYAPSNGETFKLI